MRFDRAAPDSAACAVVIDDVKVMVQRGAPMIASRWNIPSVAHKRTTPLFTFLHPATTDPRIGEPRAARVLSRGPNSQ